MLEMILPPFMKVRNVIEQVENYELQMFFKAQYLFGARASELTGKIHPSDKLDEPLGPKSSDVSAWFYEKHNIPVFLFTIKTERPKIGDPIERIIALPKEGDSWAYELFKHFKETKDNEFVFPYTRQLVYGTIRENGIFKDLKYNLSAAKQKPFPNDKLRMVRKTELKIKYGFSTDDLEAYGISKLHERDTDRKSQINDWYLYICKLYDVDMQFKNGKQSQKVANAEESYKAEWGWKKGTYVLHNIKYGYPLCNKVTLAETYPLKPNQKPSRERMCNYCRLALERIENPPKESPNTPKKAVLQEPPKIKKKLTLPDFSEPFTEKESKLLIKEMKIFDSADEKMKQAKICFQNEDYPSVLHSLNTSLELVLKGKLGIPATITNINTSNIIDILAKYKIEPYLYLIEARKYVLTIDNKIKHTGYSPSKIDCINSMKAMEELIGKLRNINLELSEEIRNKIFEGL